MKYNSECVRLFLSFFVHLSCVIFSVLMLRIVQSLVACSDYLCESARVIVAKDTSFDVKHLVSASNESRSKVQCTADKALTSTLTSKVPEEASTIISRSL